VIITNNIADARLFNQHVAQSLDEWSSFFHLEVSRNLRQLDGAGLDARLRLIAPAGGAAG
jgi:hypothetical protein